MDDQNTEYEDYEDYDEDDDEYDFGDDETLYEVTTNSLHFWISIV